MSIFLHVLLGVALVGTASSSIYCLMVVVAAVRFGLRRQRERKQARVSEFLPAISVLKPMHGTEVGMETNLVSFFEQDYPEFELLFCARQETDEGLKLARRVAERYPQVKARFVTCGEPPEGFHNAKVYSLMKMDSVAENALYITSDADARVERGYLREMVQYLKQPEVSLASCVYLGTVDEAEKKARLSPLLDAVGKSVEMTSGVMVADMLEGTKFALGPTMSVRKSAFRDVGGFEELGTFYADDFVIGNRLAKMGKGVMLATHVIRLLVEDQPFGLSFRNQLRWMQSTRRSRPWGHFGSGLTFAVPFGLLGLAWGLASGHPLVGGLWLLAMVANRWVQAGTVLGVMGDSDWVRGTVIYPLRDLLGGILWLGSYGGDRFYYRGSVYRLKDGGRVEAR